MPIILSCPSPNGIYSQPHALLCPTYAFLCKQFFSIINGFAILLHMDCSADLKFFVVYQDFLCDFNNSLMIQRNLCPHYITLQILQVIFNLGFDALATHCNMGLMPLPQTLAWGLMPLSKT